MKLIFDVDNTLYEKIKKNGKLNGRAVATEARFQLQKIYEDKE